MATESSVNAQTLEARPANAFGLYDSTSFAVVDINRATLEELVQHLKVSPAVARRIIARRDDAPITSFEQLQAIKGLSISRTFALIRGRALLARDTNLHILNVASLSEAEDVFSDRPFTLRVRFANPADVPAAVVSVTILWAGEPFVVEQEVTNEEAQRRYVDVKFDETQTLPVGPAEFRVALYRHDGAQASFHKTLYVLPSNPLALSLSPAGATVTGTWSARGAYQSGPDTFVTQCTITLANGDANPVVMNNGVTWRFWDGGVGGTLVESGAFNWPGSITVPAFGLWQGGVIFTSPHGSGIYNKYHGKEDMTIEIEMVASDGRHEKGTITCRVMLAYGVNIIKVGDFDPQEGIDLYNAVDVTRQIYEKRDITFRSVLRWIIHNADAGRFLVIHNEGDVHDLFAAWSVPNDYIDVFVCQGFDTNGFDGMSGGLPGPASKGGNSDGVALSKSGYLDSSQVKRLHIDYLGMLMGHEIGHYLGLSHINEPGNLMLASSGATDTNLNYDQYSIMLRHGFMLFI